MQTRFTPSLLALAIAATVPSTFAQSVQPLPEILVTAEFRDTQAERLASSVSVLGSEIVQARAAQSLDELLAAAPNVNLSSGASRGRFFQIRGIGERSQFVEPLNPSVGLLVDGIDFSGLGLAATLFDTEQVEVLRGPQGTRFGASGLAGVINVQTREATAQREGYIELTLADFDTRAAGVALGGALAEGLKGRLAIQHYRSDGFYENTYLRRDDTNGRDELTARFKLDWQASDSLQLKASLLRLDVDNGYDAFNFESSRETRSDEPGHDRQDTWAGTLSALWSGDAFDLLLQGSYADSDSEYSYDEDWAYVGFHPWEYQGFDRYLRDRQDWSAEVRLTSNEAGRLGNADWVVGAYLKESDEALVRDETFSGHFVSDYQTRLSALYGQMDLPLAQHWALSVGLRGERWEADYTDSQASAFTPDENLWGGRVALQYQIDPAAMAYLALSRGYKAGGINTNASIPSDLRTFDAESQLNLELGYKARLLDERLRVAAALFYADRDQQQVKNSFVVVDPISHATSFEDFIDNAAQGVNYGAELELLYQADAQWQWFAALGWLDASFDQYTTAFGDDLDGREQAHAPTYQFSGGFRHDWSNGWFTRWELEAKDGFYFSDRHNARASRYALVNAQLGYQADAWSLVLWARNLNNERYETRGFGSFGNDPRNGYLTQEYTQLGEPRFVGVTFTQHF